MREKIARIRAIVRNAMIDFSDEQGDQDAALERLEADAADSILSLLPQWKGIESAPRDGTPVLVARGDSIRWAVWSEGLWRDGQKGAGGQICGVPVPTHWMPLPSPPGEE